MKTRELRGVALDWAVAKCEGTLHDDGSVPDYFQPSVDWEQGGPIIECEGINLDQYAKNPSWSAWTPAPEQPTGEAQAYGPTPLIAAMRCYVASKLGDDIEVPADLFQ
jgi:hypothetical protein